MALPTTALPALCLLLCLLTTVRAADKLPPYVSKCPSRERAALNACALQQGRAALAHLGTRGDRKYGLPPLESITFPRVETKSSGFTLNFVDLTIKADPALSYRLDDLDVDLEGRHLRFSYSAPAVSLTSKYQAEGHLMLLPIKGDGENHARLENFKSEFSADFLLVKSEKDGLEYVKLNNTKMDVDTARATFNFTNLFDGNELLGKTTNDFLNENWRAVFHEMKWGTSEAIRLYIATSLQNFFDRIPFDEAFPE